MAMLLPSETDGPALVHCDAVRTLALGAEYFGSEDPEKDPQSIHYRRATAGNLKAIEDLLDGRCYWVPTFNYDFCQSGSYDLESDPSQVGLLTEYIRLNASTWRSHCPVFNVAGIGSSPTWRHEVDVEVDPFGADSIFGQLVQKDGAIVWYGAPLHSSTIVHHAERISGGPSYRYDKLFNGQVLAPGCAPQRVTLRYHVRPRGRRLGYDWDRLGADLDREGIRNAVDTKYGVYSAPARALVSYWSERLQEDPLYLLDHESRIWVERELERLGRPFELSDFEAVES